jgi:c-di-AMP phosphodiesterase-like protein
MEKLGGGGHQTMAAVQLEGITLTEAEEMLLKVIENIGKEEEQI